MLRYILPMIYTIVTIILIGFNIEYVGLNGWKMPTGMAVCLNGMTLMLACATVIDDLRYSRLFFRILSGLTFSWLGLMFCVAFGTHNGVAVTSLGDQVFGPRLWWTIPLPFVWYAGLLVLSWIGKLWQSRDESRTSHAQ